MVRYIDAAGDEHYVGLAEAASVPFESHLEEKWLLLS